MRHCLAIALSLWAQSALCDQAKFLQSLTWSEPGAHFGGWSAIDFLDEGQHFVAITDRRHMVDVDVARDAQGRIVGLQSTEPRALRFGRHPETGKQLRDTEGLAIGADGMRFVSLEQINRVFDATTQDLDTSLPMHSDFAQFHSNGGLEALAIDQEGRLFTLPERSGTITTDFPLYGLFDGAWRHIADVPRSSGFQPVGADFGPDGRFYLLERAFSGFGFQTRLSRFRVADGGIEDREVLLVSATGRHGNLEGLAIWQSDDGIRATMIADDNFSRFQETEIVEYLLPD
ncbi:esterase-like activity of phytase family protein [Primorskyibacter sp. S187A]|uniref:esterase-like activity of phytase family protein n=1 Tax=Primorskyibacter sp. S187A TaxID=3415130 RepID=UPI003C79D2FB